MTEKEDLMVIAKDEYDAIGKEILRSYLINFRYQARCTCKIDFKEFMND